MNMSADFCISIDYEKGSASPSRVFRVATDLIESFQEIDNYLIKSISSKIEPVILLEDIETSSVKIWLKNVLQSADDEGLKNLDWKPLVGKYLVKSKYLIIDFLENRTEITNKVQIQELNNKLLKTAEETEVKQIPLYSGMSNKNLLNGIEKITEALKPLNRDDRVEFITANEKATFNVSFKYAPEKIEELLTEKTLTTTGEMLYKVKKPDYLGESMWEVRHNQRNFFVKIMDEEWLKKFRSRNIDLRPGDSLEASVNIEVKYDSESEVISEKHFITKIGNVIVAPVQQSIFNEEDNESKGSSEEQ